MVERPHVRLTKRVRGASAAPRPHRDHTRRAFYSRAVTCSGVPWDSEKGEVSARGATYCGGAVLL